MVRTPRILVSLSILAVAGGCVPGEKGAGDVLATAGPREVAPAISIERVSEPGEPIGLDAFKGKVVLLEFWATWCGPCHAFAPTVEKLHKTYGPQGLEVVSVSDEPRSTLEGFAKKREQTYPIFMDVKQSAHLAFKIEALPTAFVIGRDGRIAFAPEYVDEAELTKAIKAELART